LGLGFESGFGFNIPDEEKQKCMDYMGGSGLDRSDDFQKFCGSGLDRIQVFRIRIGLGLNDLTVRSPLLALLRHLYEIAPLVAEIFLLCPKSL